MYSRCNTSDDSGALVTVCQYWNDTSSTWSTDGVVTLGFATIANRTYLHCASAHLTAFIGAVSVEGLSVDVNAIDPVNDVGTLTVRCC